MLGIARKRIQLELHGTSQLRPISSIADSRLLLTILWRRIPSHHAALEKLRSRGYKLTILSNGDRDMLKAAEPHIGFPFDHVISVQEAG
jgi:FMN phosphatase YigB (HAD superfamily)